VVIERDREAEIRRLFFAEHWKVGTIVTQLGLHHETVERVLGQLGPAPKVGAPIPSPLEPYKSLVEEILDRYPRLRATRIYDMLRERGYTGSLRTLRRFARRVRPAPRGEVYVRIETLPGEQSQIDWGHVGKLRVPGGERALWVFVIVLAWSRAIWAELVLDLSVWSLRRSLLRAATHLGGVTRQWLFDNPKTVVLERHGDLIRYQPALLDLCATLHVEPRLCAVRKPEHKGGVERAIRYLKERFFAARPIPSVERGNAELTRFLAEVAMQRRHPVDHQITVGQAFEREKERLLSLPEVMPPGEQVLPAVADKTATVRFDGNRYSVPPAAARKTVTLAATDTTVRVLDGEAEVARHSRSWGRNQSVEDPAHRAAILAAKPGAREGAGRDRLRASVPRIDILLEHWVADGRNVGSQIARSLKLLDLYGARVMGAALDDLLARGSHDYGALAILCEQRRRGDGGPPLPLVLGPHVADREVIPRDLGVYDEIDGGEHE
jgi:transposase